MGGSFISYRSDDAKYAAPLVYEGMKREFGEDQVFFDPSSVDDGDSVPKEIRRRLRDSAVLIVEIGPEWFDIKGADGRRRLDSRDDFVRWEVRKGLKWGLRIIPVLLDEAGMHTDRLPDDIKRLSEMPRKRFRMRYAEGDMRELVLAVSRHVPRRPHSGGTPGSGGRPPMSVTVDRSTSMNVKAKTIKGSYIAGGDINGR